MADDPAAATPFIPGEVEVSSDPASPEAEMVDVAATAPLTSRPFLTLKFLLTVAKVHSPLGSSYALM
jgi:hypothetical protein